MEINPYQSPIEDLIEDTVLEEVDEDLNYIMVMGLCFTCGFSLFICLLALIR